LREEIAWEQWLSYATTATNARSSGDAGKIGADATMLENFEDLRL
jgi:hypothetical protein